MPSLASWRLLSTVSLPTSTALLSCNTGVALEAAGWECVFACRPHGPRLLFCFDISIYTFSRYFLTVRLSCVNFPPLFKPSFTLLLPACSKFSDQT